MKPHPDFEALTVPTSFVLGDYHLDVLTGEDLEADYEAVMRSAPVLQGVFGDEWPVGLTKEYDFTDLHWHHREFTAKRSFAWVIRDKGGVYLGCAYLNPAIGARGIAEGVYWMADAPERLARLDAFGALYEDWVKELLPATFEVSFISNASL